ncbi:MAG: folylpolyglutamate synthase/dihydrofolate synthase family protein, partial [Bacteroidota bacterium]
MDNPTAYQQTLDFLYGQLPMFSKIGKTAITKDLNNTLKLCEVLDNPQNKFKSIHIAGTNGKGSTSHMLAAILQEAGFKIGLYTSPHLIDFRERIRINGQCISKEWVVDFVEQIKPFINTIKPSFFEINVAMAYKAFALHEVDFAIVETGIGGRLDSTNIITPILSIITNISFDHKDILGDTLAQIAYEKAGIIKPGVPVLIGEQLEETERVFFEQAMHQKSTVYYAQSMWDLVRIKQDAQYQYFKAVHTAHREMYDLQTDLLGTYQQHNIKTVLAAVEVLKANHGMHLSFSVCSRALTRVKKLTGLRGRWEWLQQSPPIIADVAHNPAGLNEVMNQWSQIVAVRKHIVVGFVKDKDVSEALSYFPKDATYYFCNAQIPRALLAADLQALANNIGLNGTAFSNYCLVSANNCKKMQINYNDNTLKGHDGILQFLNNPIPSIIYGLHHREKLLSIMPNSLFDFSDFTIAIKMIDNFGCSFKKDKFLIFFGIGDGYTLKPSNKYLFNPFEYATDLMKLALKYKDFRILIKLISFLKWCVILNYRLILR